MDEARNPFRMRNKGVQFDPDFCRVCDVNIPGILTIQGEQSQDTLGLCRRHALGLVHEIVAWLDRT